MLLPGIGTALGAGLGAGAAKTADNLFHHDSIGHALGQGALNGGAAYLGAGGLSKLKSLFSGGDSAVGSVDAAMARGVPNVQPFTPSSSTSMIQGPGIASEAATLPSQLQQAGGSSLMDRLGLSGLGHAANGVGSFIQHNPNAAALGLQGIGSMATAGAQNAQSRAQTALLQQELDEKRRRSQAMLPFFQALAGNGFSNGFQVTPNPYTTGGH